MVEQVLSGEVVLTPDLRLPVKSVLHPTRLDDDSRELLPGAKREIKHAKIQLRLRLRSAPRPLASVRARDLDAVRICDRDFERRRLHVKLLRDATGCRFEQELERRAALGKVDVE